MKGKNRHAGTVEKRRYWGFDNVRKSRHTFEVNMRQDGTVGFTIWWGDSNDRQNFHGFEMTYAQKENLINLLESYDPVLVEGVDDE